MLGTPMHAWYSMRLPPRGARPSPRPWLSPCCGGVRRALLLHGHRAPCSGKPRSSRALLSPSINESSIHDSSVHIFRAAMLQRAVYVPCMTHPKHDSPFSQFWPILAWSWYRVSRAGYAGLPPFYFSSSGCSTALLCSVPLLLPRVKFHTVFPLFPSFLFGSGGPRQRQLAIPS